MYFPYFIAYIAIGLILSVAVFVWAVKNGQFRDQQRARFLPLEDGPKAASLKASRIGRLEIYGLFLLALAGLSASVAIVVFAIIFAK
ncbi:MAG: cbb3-type cytochrome oxidase assembly protein CcoS [Desulfobacterales bacterium]